MNQSIILASQSPQRKKLLNLWGIPFKIHKSNIDELMSLEGTSIGKLVKHNALAKASDVAQHYDKGLVVGCDTVVYGQGNLIGKPKDLKEAKRTLKQLMKTPHWVYSGLAVIDCAKDQYYLDVDKTKVFMNRLTDKEIDAYYQKMCPLDKAGGFDIEGLGSAFIHRIEGCYFNVVGLPLAKLHAILKQCGYSILHS